MIGKNEDTPLCDLKRMGFSKIDHVTEIPEKSYLNRFFTKNILQVFELSQS